MKKYTLLALFTFFLLSSSGWITYMANGTKVTKYVGTPSQMCTPMNRNACGQRMVR